VLSYDIADAQRYWDDEIEAEYPNALLVIAHGNTDPGTGEWYAYPTDSDPLPVREVVLNVRKTYPERHIVLLVCNPDGLILDGVNNVSYARESVWIWPDRVVQYNIRDLIDPDGVGSFDEFTHLE